MDMSGSMEGLVADYLDTRMRVISNLTQSAMRELETFRNTQYYHNGIAIKAYDLRSAPNRVFYPAGFDLQVSLGLARGYEVELFDLEQMDQGGSLLLYCFSIRQFRLRRGHSLSILHHPTGVHFFVDPFDGKYYGFTPDGEQIPQEYCEELDIELMDYAPHLSACAPSLTTLLLPSFLDTLLNSGNHAMADNHRRSSSNNSNNNAALHAWDTQPEDVM